MTRPPRLAWIAWVTVCIVWGTTYLGIRVALESLPPMLLGAFRWTIAGAVIWLALAVRGQRMPEMRTWPGIAVIAFLMIGFGNGGVVWAEQYVSSGLSAVVVASCPFWMVGMEAVLGGDRLSRLGLAGLVVGFGGIVLLVWPDLHIGGSEAAKFGAGLIALQLACAGWAAGSSYSKRHATGENVIAATGLQMLFGGLLMLAAGSLTGEWHRVSFTPRTAGAMLYLTLAGSLGGFVAYIYALRHLPISTVSLYAYVNPVIAVALGALLLGEPITPRVIIAAGLVLVGLGIVRYAKSTGGHDIARVRDASPAPVTARSPRHAG